MKNTANKIIKKLQDNGFDAFIVGGAVRNQLLDIPVKDFDIVTSAKPDQIKNIFTDNFDTGGEQFGIVNIIDNGFQFEIATYRKDNNDNNDGRRPYSVTFASQIDDVNRRDFTINGLLFNPVNDDIIDYVDGVKDIKDKVIKTIGNPDDRFNEDFLRMMRAVRFASTLNFTIDNDTFKAIKNNANKIKGIAKERIFDEFKKVITSNGASKGIEIMVDTGLFNNLFNFKNAIVNKIVKRFQKAGKMAFNVALAVFLLDVNDPINVMKVALKMDNNTIDIIMDIINNHKIIKRGKSLATHQIKKVIRRKNINDNIQLLDIVDKRFKKFIVSQINKLDDLFIVPVVNGGDLIVMGFKPGAMFKVILDNVNNAQLDGVVNSKDDAIQFINDNFKKV